jgi:hypothetical protein
MLRTSLANVALFAAVASAALPLTATAQQGPTRPNLLLREVVEGMPRVDRQEVQVLAATFTPGQATVSSIRIVSR